MEEFKSNSRTLINKPKVDTVATDKPREKVEKIITGKAKSKKKTELRKAADTFLVDDVAKVKSYVLMDVLIPALKKAISDIVVNGIDMMLYGETVHAGKNGRSSRVGYSNYSNYYDKVRDPREERVRSTARAGYDYGEVIVETKGEAEVVLEKMDEIIATYGTASVADLYDLCDITTGNYTDNKYGWINLSTADSVRCPDGYILRLPKALPLN